MTSIKTTAFVMVGAGIVALLVNTPTMRAWRAKQQANIQAAPGPSTWTAFTADYVSVDQTMRANGKFCRGSDGSERRELTYSDGTVGINIKNTQSRMFYAKPPRAVEQWASMPFEADRSTTPPASVRVMSNLFVRDGIQVYSRTEGDHATRLLAPSLNFFTVHEESIDGRSEDYRNIVLTEPSRDLFEPPPGVPVVVTSTPHELMNGGPSVRRNHPKAH